MTEHSGPPMKWASVNLGQLTANARMLVGSVHEHTSVMAMVKANGYGHGVGEVARTVAAGGCTWFGVSSPEEAMELRMLGRQENILNVGWTHPDHAVSLIRERIDMTVSDVPFLEGLIAAARSGRKGRARIHVKFDSGMSRFGILASECNEILALLQGAKDVIECVGLFTHFADADAPFDDFSLEQYETFTSRIAPFREAFPDALVHCANSAAMLRYPEYQHDIVRPGIALYGYPPVATTLDLHPVMSMYALVTRVKEIPQGTSVGYGRTWIATRTTRVATIACGYADGVHRLQSNTGVVLINDFPCPIIGRVSMDQLTCDISEAGDVHPGDVACIFGDDPSGEVRADRVAGRVGTIAYEVLCAVAPRVPRTYDHKSTNGDQTHEIAHVDA